MRTRLDLPRAGEDDPYLERLPEADPMPVFVVGLHRSGTTFLYQSIVDCLGVAGLTIYDLVYYDRLLKNRFEGLELRDRAALQSYFAQKGWSTRRIDDVPLTDTTVEEYGFLFIRRRLGSRFGPEKIALLRQLCKKLAVVNDNAQTVVLKSPWDSSAIPMLQQTFPRAKFILITRDSKAVARSMFASFRELGEGAVDSYVSFLVGRNYRAQWALYKPKLKRLLLGRARFEQRLACFCARTVERSTRQLEEVIARANSGSIRRVDYRTLVESPVQVLADLAAFLQVPTNERLDSIVAKPRSRVAMPAVDALH